LRKRLLDYTMCIPSFFQMNKNSLLRASSIATTFLLVACTQSTNVPTGSGSTVSSVSSLATLPTPAVVLDEYTKSSIVEANVTVATAANAKNVNDFLKLDLTAGQQAYLNTNKFLLLPLEKTAISPGESFNNFDNMLKAFDAIQGKSMPHERLQENAKFVTPDIVLHGYHRYFELTLEELEKKDLREALASFLDGMSSRARMLQISNDPVVKERAPWIIAQMTTANILLRNAFPKPEYFATPEDEQEWIANERDGDSYANAEAMVAPEAQGLSPEMQQRIKAELKLIYDANTVTASPLFNQYNEDIKADYTQYTPRSHYTKSSFLRSYFRTMMYLGRNSYLLKKDIGLQDATLVTSLLDDKDADGSTPRVQWQKIMDITGFYAGQSGDVTKQEWETYVKEPQKKMHPIPNCVKNHLSNELLSCQQDNLPIHHLPWLL